MAEPTPNAEPGPSSGRHIALIGMAGAGKSAVARRLGASSGRRVVDIDAAIIERSGSSIPELFAAIGESGFRSLETAELEGCLASDEPLVIATGGGVVERAENLGALAARAHVVWLDADLDTLALRLRASSTVRPLLEGDLDANLQRLATARLAKYRAAADLTMVVGPDEGVAEFAARLAALMHERGWTE